MTIVNRNYIMYLVVFKFSFSMAPCKAVCKVLSGLPWIKKLKWKMKCKMKKDEWKPASFFHFRKHSFGLDNNLAYFQSSDGVQM